jgi:hypothetical protein
VNQRDICPNSVRELEKFWSEISDPSTLIPKWMHDNPLSSIWLSNWKSANELGGLILGSIWDYGKNVGDALLKNYNRIIETTLRQTRDNWPWDWPYLLVLTEEWPYSRPISWKHSWKEEWPYISGYFYWPENYSSLAT